MAVQRQGPRLGLRVFKSGTLREKNPGSTPASCGFAQADTGGPCPKIFLNHAVFRQLWANCGLRAPFWGQYSAGSALTKILDPRLVPVVSPPPLPLHSRFGETAWTCSICGRVTVLKETLTLTWGVQILDNVLSFLFYLESFLDMDIFLPDFPSTDCYLWDFFLLMGEQWWHKLFCAVGHCPTLPGKTPPDLRKNIPQRFGHFINQKTAEIWQQLLATLRENKSFVFQVQTFQVSIRVDMDALVVERWEPQHPDNGTDSKKRTELTCRGKPGMLRKISVQKLEKKSRWFCCFLCFPVFWFVFCRSNHESTCAWHISSQIRRLIGKWTEGNEVLGN